MQLIQFLVVPPWSMEQTRPFRLKHVLYQRSPPGACSIVARGRHVVDLRHACKAWYEPVGLGVGFSRKLRWSHSSQLEKPAQQDAVQPAQLSISSISSRCTAGCNSPHPCNMDIRGCPSSPVFTLAKPEYFLFFGQVPESKA